MRSSPSRSLLAHELDLPLVIHTRDAWDDTFAVLDELTTPRRTVFHCFTGGPAEAEACVERGALLSISGIVTFPSAARPARRPSLAAPLDVADGGDRLALPGAGAASRPCATNRPGSGWSALRSRSCTDVAVHEVAATTTATAPTFYGLGLE